MQTNKIAEEDQFIIKDTTEVHQAAGTFYFLKQLWSHFSCRMGVLRKNV